MWRFGNLSALAACSAVFSDRWKRCLALVGSPFSVPRAFCAWPSGGFSENCALSGNFSGYESLTMRRVFEYVCAHFRGAQG